MRTSLLALSVVLSLPIAAQTRATIDVRLIELEASVLDRAGRPVEGLKREDFQVRVGKRDVPITNFYAVKGGVVVEESATAERTVPLPPETALPTSLVIVIDDLHLGAKSHQRAIAAIKKYVAANVGANTTATLIRYRNDLDVRVRPTERAGPVLRELDAMERTVSVDERTRERVALIREIDDLIQAIKADLRTADTPDTMLRRIERYAEEHATEIDHTLRMLERSIDVIAAFSGRKVLLYVSDGLPQTPGLEMFEYYQSALDRSGIVLEGGARADAAAVLRFDRSAAYRRVVQAAQRAGVAIFSFDASGARTEVARGAESGSTMGSFSTQSINSNLRSGLQYMAAETGGQHIGNDNDIDRALARMSEQFTTYYSIGIRPAPGDIRVSVRNRKDVSVIASRRASMTTREDRLEQNLRSRLYTRDSENPLGASLIVAPPALKAAQCVAPVRLSVPLPQGLPPELTPATVELRMVMLNERNEESAMQVATLPFDQGRVEHTMMLRIRPEKLVISAAVTNPMSQETSYLQADVDGTLCR